MSGVELWPVVDYKDRIIRLATEDECHGEPKLVHRTVGVLVRNDHQEILLQKRSSTKKLYPGYFGVSASGHVRHTDGRLETYKQAAVREYLEELGTEPGKLSYIKRIRIDLPEHPTWTALYEALDNGPFAAPPEEIERLEFLTKDDIIKYRHLITPPSQTMLRKLGII